MSDAAATTTRNRASGTGAPSTGGPTPGVQVQQSATRAAESVQGVHELGTAGGRALVRAMGRVPGGRTTYGPGVSVEVGGRKAAVDVSLVVEYGVPAQSVGGEVREAVREQVQRDTGLEVVEVNVSVVGLHHPDDDLPSEPVEPAVGAESVEGTAPAVDAGAVPETEAGRPADREAGEEVERVVARVVEEGAGVAEGEHPDQDLQDAAREDGSAPRLVLATKDGGSPDVVVADQVVLADSVVVVDHEAAQDQQDEQEHRRG